MKKSLSLIAHAIAVAALLFVGQSNTNASDHNASTTVKPAVIDAAAINATTVSREALSDPGAAINATTNEDVPNLSAAVMNVTTTQNAAGINSNANALTNGGHHNAIAQNAINGNEAAKFNGAVRVLTTNAGNPHSRVIIS